MQIEKYHQLYKSQDNQIKCFDKFFIGQCTTTSCLLDHANFNSEHELKEFCDIYRKDIEIAFKKPKKTDFLLKKYILEHLDEITNNNKYSNDIKEANHVMPEDTQEIEYNQELEAVSDFENFYLKIFTESSGIVNKLINTASHTKRN